MKNLLLTTKDVLQLLKEHDLLTYEHSLRVADLSCKFGHYLGLNDASIIELYKIGLYHDVGKLYVDTSILTKEGKLDTREYQQILNHPIYGEEILKIQGYTQTFLQTIRSHHENYDGSGYPDQLDYKKINLYSFILRIVDSYDAMVNTRSYQKSQPPQFALLDIKSLRGKWYHPFFADKFCDFIKSYK